jgi:hypothetical protein
MAVCQQTRTHLENLYGRKMEIIPDRTTRVANMTLCVPVLEGNVRKVMPFGRLPVQSPINRDMSNFCNKLGRVAQSL